MSTPQRKEVKEALADTGLVAIVNLSNSYREIAAFNRIVAAAQTWLGHSCVDALIAEGGEIVWRCRETPFWTQADTREDYEAFQKRLMDPDDETGEAGHYCSPLAAHYEGCGWVLVYGPIPVESAEAKETP